MTDADREESTTGSVHELVPMFGEMLVLMKEQNKILNNHTDKLDALEKDATKGK